MTESVPIACTLTPDELAARRRELLPGLAARAERIERIADGVRLLFAPAPDLLATIAGVIEAERQCCKFLGFALNAEPNDGPIALIITAPPAAQGILAELIP